MRKIYSVDGLFGGGLFRAQRHQRENFYGADGRSTGYSVDSPFGGKDYFGSDGSRGYSVDSVVGGGQNYYFDGADPFSGGDSGDGGPDDSPF